MDVSIFSAARRHRQDNLLRIAVETQRPVKGADRYLVRPRAIHRHGNGALNDVLRERSQVEVVVLAQILHLAADVDCRTLHGEVARQIRADHAAEHKFLLQEPDKFGRNVR